MAAAAEEGLTAQQLREQFQRFEDSSEEEKHAILLRSQRLAMRYINGDIHGVTEDLNAHPMTAVVKFHVLEFVKVEILNLNAAMNHQGYGDRNVLQQQKNNAKDALEFFDRQPPHFNMNGGKRRSRRRKSRRRRSRRY